MSAGFYAWQCLAAVGSDPTLPGASGALWLEYSLSQVFFFSFSSFSLHLLGHLWGRCYFLADPIFLDSWEALRGMKASRLKAKNPGLGLNLEALSGIGRVISEFRIVFSMFS